LLADIDRRPVQLEGSLDGLHSAVNPGAVTTWLSKQDSTRLGWHGTHFRRSSSAACRPPSVSSRLEWWITWDFLLTAACDGQVTGKNDQVGSQHGTETRLPGGA
jgi:hypothetical protein